MAFGKAFWLHLPYDTAHVNNGFELPNCPTAATYLQLYARQTSQVLIGGYVLFGATLDDRDTNAW